MATIDLDDVTDAARELLYLGVGLAVVAAVRTAPQRRAVTEAVGGAVGAVLAEVQRATQGVH